MQTKTDNNMNQRAFDYIDKLDNEFFNDLRDKLVPGCGKADTVAGEIIRAMDRLIYRFWNDGDMVGDGYGNETCNGSYRYMYHKLPTCPDLYGESGNEDGYAEALAALAEEVMNYLKLNPGLQETPNHDDSRSDYDEPEDYQWYNDEEEDEDDEYDGRGW